ncbi:MAG TPA: spermidine/putrescine ABC transporter substrate-binding protein [Acidimicrobiales bacterium]
MSDDGMKILVPPATLQRVVAGISRRRFLEVGLGGVAAAAILAACGGDNSGSSSGASTSAGAAASGGGNSGANKFNLFTWAEYDDPDLMKKFGDITIDVYNSNEDAIAKLEAGGGTSGYDMVVPTGVYIPQMVSKSLLEEIDVSRIPNFANLEQVYTNQPWDPGNKHSVCKDWGTTGWIYDNTVITTPINSWQEFLDAAKSEGVAGKVSIIDSPADVTGLYFWAKGIDWNTTNPADLDAAEQYLTKELAPHLKALDSYPGINLTQGNYVLSQVFNGDARQGLLKVEEAGGDPKKYTYSIGKPKSELWMDNWCIVKGAKNVDAAYNFMNFILDPDNSATDTLYHGYNPGVKGVEDKVADMKYKEIVFLTPAEVSTLTGQKLDAQERQVDIYNKVKAAAGS